MPNPGSESIEFFRNRYNIDSAAMSSLLSIALSRGGDFAELFFEHRTNSAIQWEDQRVKSASRNVSQGLGMRVIKGDAIGYAYTESLDLEAMRRAADTAARIASRGERPTPVDAMHSTPQELLLSHRPVTDAPAPTRSTLSIAPMSPARAYDSGIARVDVNFIDELKHVMIVPSDGRITGDMQPLVRFNVCASRERRGAARPRAGAAAAAWAWRTSNA